LTSKVKSTTAAGLIPKPNMGKGIRSEDGMTIEEDDWQTEVGSTMGGSSQSRNKRQTAKRPRSKYGILTKAGRGKLEMIRSSREMELRQDLEKLKSQMGLVSAKIDFAAARTTSTSGVEHPIWKLRLYRWNKKLSMGGNHPFTSLPLGAE
jgi:hypothetical protein